MVFHGAAFKVVVDADAYDTLHFKVAGFALLAAEPVGEVHLVQKVYVDIVYHGLVAGCPVACLAFESEAPYGCNLLGHFKASHETDTFESLLARCLGHSAYVDTDGPVVEKLVSGHLCVGTQDEEAQRC